MTIKPHPADADQSPSLERRDLLTLALATASGALIGCATEPGSPKGTARLFVEPVTAADYVSTMKLGSQATDFLEMAYEPAGFKNAVGAADFDAMVNEGKLDHLRIPACCPARANVDGVISEAFLLKLDNQINLALARFERVLLDPLHHYNQWKGTHQYDKAYDDYVRVAQLTADQHAVRATAMWTQLATRYKNTSTRLSFDLFNEPSQSQEAGYPIGLSAQQLDAWHAAVIPAIRATGGVNANRMIWMEPFATDFNTMAVPANAGPIGVSPHSYLPFTFTLGPGALTAGGMALYAEDVKYMKAWGVANKVPIWIGETGTSLKTPSGVARSPAERAEFAAHIRNTAHATGTPICYWGHNGEFAMYDQVAKQWLPSMQQAASALPSPLPTRAVPSFTYLKGGRIAKEFDKFWPGFSYDPVTGILSAVANDTGHDQNVVVVFPDIPVASGQTWIARASSFSGRWLLGGCPYAYDPNLPNRQGVLGVDIRAKDSQGHAIYPYRPMAPGGAENGFGNIATPATFFAADLIVPAGSPAGRINLACIRTI